MNVIICLWYGATSLAVEFVRLQVSGTHNPSNFSISFGLMAGAKQSEFEHLDNISQYTCILHELVIKAELNPITAKLG